jgi:hypothetical protein
MSRAYGGKSRRLHGFFALTYTFLRQANGTIRRCQQRRRISFWIEYGLRSMGAGAFFCACVDAEEI